MASSIDIICIRKTHEVESPLYKFIQVSRDIGPTEHSRTRQNIRLRNSEDYIHKSSFPSRAAKHKT
jgi:hypothetical protein